MPCRLSLAVVLVVAGCGRGGGPTSPRRNRPAGPSIAVDEPVFDFGQVGYGQATIKHRFIFRNAGSMPLHIQDVKSSCGCAVAKNEKKVFQAGEEGHVDVALDVRTMGDSEPGHPIEHVIVVKSNDPAAPVAKLVLRGTRVKNLFYYPSVVAFEPVFVGHAATQAAYYLPSPRVMATSAPSVDTTANYLKAHIERKRFESSPLPEGLRNVTKEFSFALDPASYPREGYVMTVELLPNAPAGQFYQYVTLRTGDPVDPQLMVRVVGDVREPLEISPRRMFLGLLTRDDKLSRQITVRSPEGRSFTVMSVVSEVKMIVPSFRRIAPDQWVIELQLSPESYCPGYFRGHLVFTTDFPTMEKFTLGVYGRADE